MAPLTRPWARPDPWGDGQLTEEILHSYRSLARNNLEWATGFGVSPRQPDSVEYSTVIDRAVRGWFLGYSACGDLAHWMLYTLGVRLGWVNWSPWRVGRNISLLMPGACACAQPVVHLDRVECGDVIVVANHQPPNVNDDHAIVVVQQLTDDLIETAEYGAAYPVAGGLRTQHVVREAHRTRLTSGSGRTRTVQSLVPLREVITTAYRTACLVDGVEYLRPADILPPK